MNPRSLLRAPRKLAADVLAARQPPILIIGLPRSGSSWLGDVLATAEGVKYYREPFNCTWQPEAEPYQYLYLREEDAHLEFDTYVSAAFEGRVPKEHVDRHVWGQHRRFDWWPGRVLIKEVHAILAAERIEHVANAEVIVIVRHPGALAASWSRMREKRPDGPQWYDIDSQLDRLLAQPQLIEDYLRPYVEVLERARSGEKYFEKVGAMWGAVYHVILSQAARRGWTIVTHESLCGDAEGQYGKLYEELDLRWSKRTTEFLQASTTAHSERPFETQRISEDEPDKWRDEMPEQEVEEVLSAVRPFGIDLYPSLS